MSRTRPDDDECECKHAPMGMPCPNCTDAGFDTLKNGVVQNGKLK
ncbi:hypothetical protein [Halocatena marina]|nr:hypothetical protein [Halocatena marina]